MTTHLRAVSPAIEEDEALVALVRAYHDRVYRFGLRACRDAFDADDAVQEAFVKLAARPDVQRDPGVLAWLFTTVRRLCLRLVRPFVRERERLGERIDSPDGLETSTLSPEQALERWRLVERVHRALASLPAELREVLVLRDLEGRSGEETCVVLGVSEAAMKSRLHRARATLRRALAADQHVEPS